jgi:putative transposase
MDLKPAREHATRNAQTYFVTAITWQRRPLFKAKRWAELFVETLLSYRGRAYRLHEYVVMPGHFHALITPEVTLERAVQIIKGGFSFRAKKELHSSLEIWQRGFSDHRVRDAEDYAQHVSYIMCNPLKKDLADTPDQYPYCSRFAAGREHDDDPHALKPHDLEETYGTAEAVPFSNPLDN